MPRQARIDFPGAIHHVIARGIEKKKIFRDKKDRDKFLCKLGIVLEKTNCCCYAWVLMENHFHLLIRTGKKPLTLLMRKLLTSYAVYFNKRHQRAGYLFQNRFKSILCQEDTYFLELIRYIHLNPVRAKIITTLTKLDAYRWTGHSAVMGYQKCEWLKFDEILSHFGNNKREALKKYRQFIQDGIQDGYRKDLTGGGLIRSAGGWKGVLQLKKSNEFWRSDERVLGDSGFVSTVFKHSEEKLKKQEQLKRAGWNLNRLIKEICRRTGVKRENLKKKGRKNALSQAKTMIAYYGYYELGLAGNILAQQLGISQPGFSLMLKRGEKFIKDESFQLIVNGLDA